MKTQSDPQPRIRWSLRLAKARFFGFHPAHLPATNSRASMLLAYFRPLARSSGPPRSMAKQTKAASIDLEMMTRCIKLSKDATADRELPFAALVCKEGSIIAEASNRVVHDGDVSRHAEILALSLAQGIVGRTRLRGHTLYSNVEPCPMCSFAIRETGIRRVVYAIRSPVMGGHSRWNILQDPELSRVMPVYFSKPPEVVAGFCASEAEKVWNDSHPLLWRAIKARRAFG